MRSRWIIVGLAVLAAIAFAMSVQGGRWWSIGPVEIGPFGSKQCMDGECQAIAIGGSERFLRTGMGAWAAGLIAALVLVVLAAGVASRRMPKLAAKTALVAIATALATGALFFAQVPDVPGTTMARGLVLFAAGVVLGTIAAVLVLKGRPAAAG